MSFLTFLPVLELQRRSPEPEAEPFQDSRRRREQLEDEEDEGCCPPSGGRRSVCCREEELELEPDWRRRRAHGPAGRVPWSEGQRSGKQL